MNKRKYLILLFIISIIALSYFAYDSFASERPVPISSVEIKSENANYDRKEAGAWKVTKSAKWIDKGKARITFNVDTITKSGTEYNDFILVLDTSSSMVDDRIRILKKNSLNLVESILEDSNNRVGLITFSTESTILSQLSDDESSIVSSIENINVSGDTNYYKALVSVDEVLKQNTSDRNVVVLFLTDGYPNVNTPNEIAQYRYLKNKYQNVTFTGVQYEMGDVVLLPLKNITESQYIADKDTLHNVLFEAIKSHLNYDNFILNDFVDTRYFEVLETTKTIGEVNIENNKITWDIDDLQSGDLNRQNLMIDIKLKDEYLNLGDIYPTNENTLVKSKIGNLSEDVEKNETPKISNRYKVTYDFNVPSDCNNSYSNITENNFVFDTIEINKTIPECKGYQFKGWELKTDIDTRINDDYFVMPEKDVEFGGTWSKLNIKKSADGTVSKVQTLYNIMKDQAVLDNINSTYVSSSTGIDFSTASSDTNGKGVYEVASTHNTEYPIYYYRGAVQNNNVLFADMCFKAVISTDTGGVKLIYNGLPSSTGTCNNSGEDSTIGNSKFNSDNEGLAAVSYMYSANYKYTRKTISPYWYSYASKSVANKNIYETKAMASTSYYYGDTITWDEENNKYVLSNGDASDLAVVSWETNYSQLVGKYTCFSGEDTVCEKVNYIAGGTAANGYYLEMSNGKYLNNYRYVSNDISYDATTKMYTLNNPINVSENWYTNHASYYGYYLCSDLNSTTCKNVYYINKKLTISKWQNRYEYDTFTTNTYARVITMSNGETYESLYDKAMNVEWYIGNSVDADGNLTDVVAINPAKWIDTEYAKFDSHHYSCLSSSTNCNTLYYVTYTDNADRKNMQYIILPKGKTIEEAFKDMYNTNVISSTIKGDNTKEGTVDYWYYNNIELKGYSKYIEDTVYCNDRSVTNYGSFDPNGGTTVGANNLYFSFYDRTNNPSVNCSRNVDKYTVSDLIGNGALDYPVGLLSGDEVIFSGYSTKNSADYKYLNNDKNFWILAPSYYSIGQTGYSYPELAYVYNSFYNNKEYAYISRIAISTYEYGVRPVISLKPGIRTNVGDGTINDPYQIEMED